MFAICLKASHTFGMGHFFRMLNFINVLLKNKKEYVFLINNNEYVIQILETKKIRYEILDIDCTNDWETAIINKYSIEYWINDRLNTNAQHAINIKKNNCKLINFDDFGSEAKLCDINICGLYFQHKNIEGRRVLKGIEYLILNQEIIKFQKQRYRIKNILVSLGGSDTYGVTVRVVKILKKYKIKATIHLGPSFKHLNQLQQEMTSDYKIITKIPSLIKEFDKYDLAITGGGITPFEANASGLPCLIIANELFEIQSGEFLQELQTSRFLGYYTNIKEDIFSNLFQLDITKMSLNGLEKIKLDAANKIYNEIIRL
ncbi:MAG: hypothetical protein WC141_07765 [Arcobacteraceae bacterium]